MGLFRIDMWIFDRPKEVLLSVVRVLVRMTEGLVSEPSVWTARKPAACRAILSPVFGVRNSAPKQ